VNGCETIHKGQTHFEHLIKFWLRAYARSIKVYAPVFFLSLLFSSKKSITTYLSHVARSSAFLATYTSLAWFSQCIIRNLKEQFSLPLGSATRKQMQLSTFISGLSTLIETPSRQSELAVYCLSYAGDSILKVFEKQRGLVIDPIINQFLAALAFGVLLHNHTEQPKIVIKYLFKFSHM